jgi:hypothetical protein
MFVIVSLCGIVGDIKCLQLFVIDCCESQVNEQTFWPYSSKHTSFICFLMQFRRISSFLIPFTHIRNDLFFYKSTDFVSEHTMGFFVIGRLEPLVPVWISKWCLITKCTHCCVFYLFFYLFCYLFCCIFFQNHFRTREVVCGLQDISKTTCVYVKVV